MAAGWRSKAARELAATVKDAGGTMERTGKGQIKVTGPDGSVTIHEPGGETRRDLRRSSVGRLIEQRTGLLLGDEN